MKESGVYERGLFGDLMIYGIACGIKKTILIFITSKNAPHDPISVCDPRKFGVEPSTNIPVVIAYNMVHYESMHPVNPSDVTKTINLVEQYLNGSYQFSHGDLKSILGTDSESEDNLSNVDSRETENLIDETHYIEIMKLA